MIVEELEDEDFGRRTARINPKCFEDLRIVFGDSIKLENIEKNRVAIVFAQPSRVKDLVDVIKLDPLTRRDLGVQLGDIIKISKIKVNSAEEVQLAGFVSPVVIRKAGSLAKQLENTIVVKGSLITLSQFARPIPPLTPFIVDLQVVDCEPQGAVEINSFTEISVSHKSIEELKMNPFFPSEKSLFDEKDKVNSREKVNTLSDYFIYGTVSFIFCILFPLIFLFVIFIPGFAAFVILFLCLLITTLFLRARRKARPKVISGIIPSHQVFGADRLKQVENNPNNSDLLKDLSDIYFINGDYLNSIDCLKNIKDYTSYSSIQGDLGFMYLRVGDYEESLKAFKQSLSLAGKNYNILMFMGISYFYLDQVNKAIECFNQALDLNYKDPNAYCNLAAVYNIINEYEKAIELCNKALSIKPKFVKALAYLCYAYIGLDKSDKTVDIFKKIIKINEDNALYWLSMGSLYAEKRDYDKAIWIFYQALEVLPDDKWFWYNLAQVHKEKGELQEAITICNNCLLIDSKFKQGLELKKSLGT